MNQTVMMHSCLSIYIEDNRSDRTIEFTVTGIHMLPVSSITQTTCRKLPLRCAKKRS